jgi:hypothetical protein
MEPIRPPPPPSPHGPAPEPIAPEASVAQDLACADGLVEPDDRLAAALERHRARLGVLPALEAAEGELVAAAEALAPATPRWWSFARPRPAPPAPAAQLRLRSALRGLELHLWALDRELPGMDADRRALAAAPDPRLRALAEQAEALQAELLDQRAALRALLETASTHAPEPAPAIPSSPRLPAGAELVDLARAAAAVLHPRTEAWAERARAFDRDAAALRAAAAEVDAALARGAPVGPPTAGRRGA